ncbi:MAG TPA: VOC family protein [Micromonosporaceae bacterium]|nr:VOC family protein [Micromonosporaceae bacterium]
MTAPADTADRHDVRRCGCCGRNLPAGKVAELGTTPGVFICAGCALWAARRARPLSLVGGLPVIRSLRRRRHRRRSSGHITAQVAIPILPSSDLARTAAFYTATGFVKSDHRPGHLLLHNAGVELRFAHPGAAASGECYVHVGDVRALYKRLREQGVDGLSQVVDQDHGLSEFVLTDPDGNRVHFGSPVG